MIAVYILSKLFILLICSMQFISLYTNTHFYDLNKFTITNRLKLQ